MRDKKNTLLKIIRYRISYSGTKETDILYKQVILKKIDIFTIAELELLSNLFIEISDTNIFSILTNKLEAPLKYKKLFKKISDE